MQILLLLLIAFLLLPCIALAIAYRRLARNARHNRAGMLALTDTLPLGIATLDRTGRHRYVNAAYADQCACMGLTEPLLEYEAPGARGLHQRVGCVERGRQRLLHQHVAASLQRSEPDVSFD